MTDEALAAIRHAVETALQDLSGAELRQLMRDWSTPVSPEEYAEALND